MPNHAAFSISKDTLHRALKDLKQFEGKSRVHWHTLEITITAEKITLVIPGVSIPLPATTTGAAKFTMQLKYFTQIVSDERNEELHFTLGDYELKLRNFSWGVYTTFFENDRVLRSINLPVNFTLVDVARMFYSNQFTPEEIQFNNLVNEVGKALSVLEEDVRKAAFCLKKYGVKKKDLQELVQRRLR